MGREFLRGICFRAHGTNKGVRQFLHDNRLRGIDPKDVADYGYNGAAAYVITKPENGLLPTTVITPARFGSDAAPSWEASATPGWESKPDYVDGGKRR